jgi:hypothetical protein
LNIGGELLEVFVSRRLPVVPLVVFGNNLAVRWIVPAAGTTVETTYLWVEAPTELVQLRGLTSFK